MAGALSMYYELVAFLLNKSQISSRCSLIVPVSLLGPHRQPGCVARVVWRHPDDAFLYRPPPVQRRGDQVRSPEGRSPPHQAQGPGKFWLHDVPVSARCCRDPSFFGWVLSKLLYCYLLCFLSFCSIPHTQAQSGSISQFERALCALQITLSIPARHYFYALFPSLRLNFSVLDKHQKSVSEFHWLFEF